MVCGAQAGGMRRTVTTDSLANGVLSRNKVGYDPIRVYSVLRYPYYSN